MRDSVVTVRAPRFEVAEFRIVGTAPYVQHKFSQKARQQMHETQVAGSTAKKGTKRNPKDFEAEFVAATHRDAQGRCGIPAPAFRNALISACRIVGFAMTRAKLSLFVEADSFDADDGTPLVFIEPEPHYSELAVRNETGVPDLRARPMWDPGWRASVRISYDADQFTLTDVTNLLLRAGVQVGIGEGRPDSKRSAGMGWGLFRLESGGGYA
jgi:hypothetical protein